MITLFKRHIINGMIQLKNGQIHLTLNKHDTEFKNIVKQLDKKTPQFFEATVNIYNEYYTQEDFLSDKLAKKN